MNIIDNLAKFNIVNKEGMENPFVLNREQRSLIREMSGKDVILKSRQIGFSSAILGLFTLDFLLKENSRSVCISHDSPSAQRLLDRVKFFLASAEKKGLLVNLKYNSRNELVNSDKNSTFYIGAAGSRSFGRGDTLSNLHLSEFAFYEDPERLLSSVLQAVVPDGKVFIETTPNGINFFKDYWERSKAGKTGFKTHFFDNSFYSQEFLDQKKKELGERLFKQEYAINDVECFLFSGDPYFDMESLRKYLEGAVLPAKRGDFVGYNPPVFEESENGYWRIWEMPIESHQYILSVDVGETKDFCAGCILDRTAFKVVATFHGHLEASLFAEELVKAGKYYNQALIAPEKNGPGIAVLQRLRDLYYPTIYIRQVIDSVTKTQSTDFGWLTTSKTRPLMLSELQTAIKQRTLWIQDKETVKELMSFARNDKGKPEALLGAFDDRVIALAIAVCLHQTTSAPVSGFDTAVWEQGVEADKRRWGL